MRRLRVRIIVCISAGIAGFSAFMLLHFFLPRFKIAPFVFCGYMLLVIIAASVVEYRIFYAPLNKMLKVRNRRSADVKNPPVEKMPFDASLRKLAERYNGMAAEFEKLEVSRKSFLSNISHELRSPITSIQGFLQAMLDGTIDKKEYKQYIKLVLDETKRLKELVASMLNLAQLESGNLPVVSSVFDINEAIRGVCGKFQRKIYNKSMALDTDLKMDPCYVFADKEKIEQVLINLIENAVNYSPENTRICVTTAAHIKKAYITVEDQGFGIGPEDQKHIFDRFFTVDKARTPSKTKGTGLGLAIVKEIIQNHGEILWVESEKDKGTKFTFTLMLFDPSEHVENLQF